MGRKILLLLVCLCLFPASTGAGDLILSAGAGSGLLAGSPGGGSAYGSVAERHPAFVSVDLAWKFLPRASIGLRNDLTVEQGLLDTLTLHAGYHFLDGPIDLSAGGGVAVTPDPLTFGAGLNGRFAWWFQEDLGLVFDLSCTAIFAGSGLTGNGVLVPLLGSLGLAVRL